MTTLPPAVRLLVILTAIGAVVVLAGSTVDRLSKSVR